MLDCYVLIVGCESYVYVKRLEQNLRKREPSPAFLQSDIPLGFLVAFRITRHSPHCYVRKGLRITARSTVRKVITRETFLYDLISQLTCTSTND